MRPIDLARPHALSAQAVRNYEAAGILPAADRTPSGYRTYTSEHAHALQTFLALIPAHGHAEARSIMTQLNNGRTDQALIALDRSHAELLTDRQALDAIEQALTELTQLPNQPRSFRPVSIGALAHRLGLRPTTLRRWERAGLLHPSRDRATGYRVYESNDVRDAHLVHQLRRSGHPLAQITPLLDELRHAGSPTAVASAIADRRELLHARARAMLEASAEIGRYLRVRELARCSEGR